MLLADWLNSRKPAEYEHMGNVSPRRISARKPLHVVKVLKASILSQKHKEAATENRSQNLLRSSLNFLSVASSSHQRGGCEAGFTILINLI